MTVSSDSIAYAKSLGGTSHEGETLYFVIGASVESEPEAQAMLEDAIPLFGDMQSYFIVQRSDNFQGMEPGWWVIIEAYRSEPSPENLDFDRRGFPDAYVESATVRTSDPIPVYERNVVSCGATCRGASAEHGTAASQLRAVRRLGVRWTLRRL